MAKGSDNKLAFSLIDLYSKLYLDRYGRPCSVNKYRDKWAMLDLVDSVGYDRAVELFNYYFKISNRNGHTLQWFMYNFDRLDDMLKKSDEDLRRRAMIRATTKKMVEESVEH